MKIFNKFQKGEYEYAGYKRILVLVLTIFMYAISLMLYFAGIITTGSNKNLLTIVAVLGFLPASKMLISAIMHFRVKIQDESFRNEIDDAIGDLNGMYHIYLTSNDNNFYLAHLVVTNDSLIAFTDDKKFDQKKFDEHMDKHMKIDGINNVLIKVFTDSKLYINRLKQLNDVENSEKANKKLYELLVNISL